MATTCGQPTSRRPTHRHAGLLDPRLVHELSLAAVANRWPTARSAADQENPTYRRAAWRPLWTHQASRWRPPSADRRRQPRMWRRRALTWRRATGQTPPSCLSWRSWPLAGRDRAPRTHPHCHRRQARRDRTSTPTAQHRWGRHLAGTERATPDVTPQSSRAPCSDQRNSAGVARLSIGRDPSSSADSRAAIGPGVCELEGARHLE
jgi:hypothetical protein